MKSIYKKQDGSIYVFVLALILIIIVAIGYALIRVFDSSSSKNEQASSNSIAESSSSQQQKPHTIPRSEFKPELVKKIKNFDLASESLQAALYTRFAWLDNYCKENGKDDAAMRLAMVSNDSKYVLTYNYCSDQWRHKEYFYFDTDNWYMLSTTPMYEYPYCEDNQENYDRSGLQPTGLLPNGDIVGLPSGKTPPQFPKQMALYCFAAEQPSEQPSGHLIESTNTQEVTIYETTVPTN